MDVSLLSDCCALEEYFIVTGVYVPKFGVFDHIVLLCDSVLRSPTRWNEDYVRRCLYYVVFIVEFLRNSDVGVDSLDRWVSRLNDLLSALEIHCKLMGFEDILTEWFGKTTK